MTRSSLLWGTLLACACGSTPKPTTSPMPNAAGGTAAAATDDAMAARLTFANPGGMWLPSQMSLPQHDANLRNMGVAMEAKTLTDPLAAPLAAIVSLGGCSASFVSPDGLVVTNHHCVQGALQHNATKANNVVENGFLAKTKADEVSAGPSQKIFVLQAYRDVTKDIVDGLAAIADDGQRNAEFEKREKAMIGACEKDRPGLRCRLTSYFSGGMYHMLEYLEIRDVRLVYVPHRSVGNYGGEIDNWAWPRHTGDFSFYRAYVGPDGKPADFAKENVPFKPKHFLKVSDQGLRVGDFVMVTGYPGRTNRTATAARVHHDVEWAYPNTIEYLKQRYALVEKHLADGNETAIKAGVAKQGIQNGLENYQGKLAGLTKGDLLKRKDELDAKIKAWAAQPGHEAYKTAIEKLEAIEAAERTTARVDVERERTLRGSSLLSVAHSLVRMSDERSKPDAERELGYQDRDMPSREAGQKGFARRYDETLDREGFRLSLINALQLPAADRTWMHALLGAKKGAKLDAAFIDATLASWYKNSKLTDLNLRVQLLKTATLKQLKSSKDPFIQAALRVYPMLRAEEAKDKAQDGQLRLVAPMYAEAMRQVLEGFMSPDANSSLRITYGTVRGFKPGSTEAADLPFTLASQIPGKDTGKDPFDAPKAMLEAIKAKAYGKYADPKLGGELAVDFLSDLDITGGNSGSATLNDKGELVGLAFDGTTEGVASDVVFNGSTTRTIHVDARYMLWVMDMIDNADHLITEMGLTPSN